MHFRDFLKLREDRGEIIRIKQEVDWNLEAAAIAALNYRNWAQKKVLRFESIKGYRGFTLVSGLFSNPLEKPWNLYAEIMGLGRDVSMDAYYEGVKAKLAHRVPPTVVTTGPCKENILKGKDANLFALPFPYLHEGDGGRYGTLQTWIGKDPDSSWVNYGNYRLEIHSRHKLGSFLTPGQHHADLFYQKYEARGKPMPCCIAIGVDPAIMLVSTMPIPRGVSEVDMAGSFGEEPIELVRAETNDLLVPAHAEIILEGEMLPGERMDEGPFGEYHGFQHGPRTPMPVMRVHCITHRNDPIIPFTAEGNIGTESTEGIIYNWGIIVELALGMLGISVKRAWMQKLVNFAFLPVMIQPTYPGVVQDVFNAIRGALHQGYLEKWPIFDDVEVDDLDSVVEAMFLKTHPTNFRVDKAEFGMPQERMFHNPEDKKKGLLTYLLCDATWPVTWGPDQIPQKPSFENSYPSEVQQWITQNWNKLGLQGQPKVKGT